MMHSYSCHILQSALESGQEARIEKIDLNIAFDRVNHRGFLYKLGPVLIGRSVLPYIDTVSMK